ncbi:MAG TPA: ATP-binding protein [Terriglobales bacterium]|jgi:two-component system sensor histidine kinase CpxA|nr:ATP-binding protein [Terriglobales bacterium]
MKSLFLKIFLSFWVAQALFVVVAILATVAMRPTRQISAIEAEQPKFLSEAIIAYQAGGADRLREYLHRLHENQHIRAALFRDHESLIGHSIPPWFVEVENGQRHTTDTFLGRLNPHFQMLRNSTTGPDGHQYTLVTELPPGQSALFGPNGIPGIGIVIAVLTSGLVCYFLAQFLSSPVIRLRKATQRLASGDLSARVGSNPSQIGDEISQLMRDFDLMAEQIEKLVNAQSRLLKDISHELRSPLARLSVALELARQRTGPEGQSVLDRISLESSRMNELIGSLTTIARLESGAGSLRKQPVQLEDLVQEVARDAAFEAQSRNIQVECEILDELPASGDPALLRSAIENVVRNATRYTRPDTAVAIRAEKRKSGNFDAAYIQVSDSGPGVSEDELEKIFEPFYRIDDARERSTGGVGLGLAITDQAIRLHGGSVRASNLPEGGLLVEMRIPLRSGQGLQDQRAPVVASKVL